MALDNALPGSVKAHQIATNCGVYKNESLKLVFSSHSWAWYEVER